MNSSALTRKLNSVGKEAFANHYSLFKDYANRRISKEKAVNELVRLGRSNEDGAAMRLSNASIIFKEKAHCEALLMIQNSEKLADETVRLAKRLYDSECKP